MTEKNPQQMRFPPNMIASGQPNPAAMQSLYKVAPPNGGPLRRKRSRSPSPPPMASNLYKPTHIHIQSEWPFFFGVDM